MKIVKKVGFFKELPYGEETAESVHAAVGRLSQGDVENVVRYLKSGVLMIGSPGISTDVVSSSGSKIGPIGVLTDGAWAWPMELAYYVEKYRVSVPHEFLDHMRKVGWKVDAVNINEVSLDRAK